MILDGQFVSLASRQRAWRDVFGVNVNACVAGRDNLPSDAM